VRRAAKTDANAGEIVETIYAAGWKWYQTGWPCDGFAYHPGYDLWQSIEIKNPEYCRKDGTANEHARKTSNRQEQQMRFIEETSTPVVTTREEVVLALAAAIDRRLQPPGAAGRSA
jgi:hypothetical protein